jgi:hypothetical protein
MLGVVLAYGGQHRHQFGSHGLIWHGTNEASVFISFTTNLDLHRDALNELVSDPDELIVCQVAVSGDVARALMVKLTDELNGRYSSVGIGIDGVEVVLMPGEEALGDQLVEQYGDAVNVTVCSDVAPCTAGRPAQVSVPESGAEMSDASQPSSTSTQHPIPAPAVSTPTPDPAARANRNLRNSPMGSLCWARRAVVLALVDRLGERTSSARRDSLIETFAVSAAELDEIHEELPSEVADFATRFAIDLGAAASTLSDDDDIQPADLAFLFDFEKYPQVGAYVDLAEASPSCTDP